MVPSSQVEDAGSLGSISGGTETTIAILTHHAAFSEQVVSHLRRAGLPCAVTRFTSEDALGEALRAGGFEAALVDHRLPLRSGQRADALVGFQGVTIAIAAAGLAESVHPRFDQVVSMGDVPRLAVILATLTERRRAFAAGRDAQEARRKAERRLSLLQEVAHTAVLCVGADGTIDSGNGEAELLFGRPENRLVGRPITEFLPTISTSQFGSSEAWAVNVRVTRPGRGEITTEVRGFPLPGSGTILVLEDEGGAKGIALQAAQRRLDLLAEMFPGVIYILQLKHEDATPERFLWVGVDSDAILGEPVGLTRESLQWLFLSRIPDDDRARFLEFAVRAAGSTGVETVEHRIEIPDHEPIWLRHYATSVRNPETQVIALYGLMLDITEEVSARDRTELLSTVIDQAANSVIITDTDGTIAYVNPAFETITGFSRDEAIGENPRLLQSGRQSPEYYREMWSQLSSGKPWEAVFENRRKDGSIYRQKSTISPVTDRYGVVRYVGIAQDVTREHNLIAELEKLRGSRDGGEEGST